MTPDPPDSDLRKRFDRLRQAEPDIPGFRTTLAAAKLREASSASRRHSSRLAPIAIFAPVVLVAASVLTFKPYRTSLTDWPVLLQAAGDAAVPFQKPLFADVPLPSDSLLPFHLHIRL